MMRANQVFGTALKMEDELEDFLELLTHVLRGFSVLRWVMDWVCRALRRIFLEANDVVV